MAIRQEALQVSENDLNYFKTIEKLEEIRSSVNRFSPKERKQWEKDLQAKEHLYRFEQYHPRELIRMQHTIIQSAEAVGGLPTSHHDALEKRGWMVPFLLGYDEIMTGRWNYWTEIMLKGTIEGSGPIPQIDWSTDHLAIHQVRKMLFHCMDGVWHESVSPEDFADWLLWGLAGTDQPPKISERVSEHWFKTFDLALVLSHPTDYLSGLLEDLSSKGHRQALGYFSTPPAVTQLMASLVMSNANNPVQPSLGTAGLSAERLEEMKMQTAYDATVGCGATLLPASNYCLFAAGQDINSVAVKFCLIQFYWYAPWYAKNPFNK
ncbi:hypothetical protein [Priestia megaterium]|uniref:hypothetical protein n=1 Tax=Priestia megaterium TaxID=1404 RepID=UPI000BFC2677|nr:hypothetical protein [Priestia megaterium]PGQ88174.1 hypothetical protein COA18_04420 [Priestia megaterium]